MGIELLLEAFASEAHPRDWHGRFRVGDVVRVLAGKRGNPKSEVVGRIQRFTSNDTAIVSPEHGGAHIEAKPNQISFHDPNSHRQMLKRMSALDPQKPPAQTWTESASDRDAIDQARRRRAATIAPKAQESSIDVMLEAFAPASARSSSSTGTQYRTSQSQQFGKVGVQSWSAAKHPRAGGGKFGYTTGGKRATRSSPASGRYLAVGSKGALIKSIQRQLHVAQDGQYGPQTRAAVVSFQRQHGLTVDGVVGAQTLAALRGHVNAKAIAPGPITSRAATVRKHPAARAKRKPTPAFPATGGTFAGGVRI